MSDLLVRSERVVLGGKTRPAGIHVRDGRIAALVPHGDRPAGVRELDAGALVVAPGLVDTHVHVNEPGRTDWEGFEAATRAAAAGGVTTLIDMPLNSVPATTSVAALEAKHGSAEGQCHVDVAFWGGVVPGNVSDLEPLARAGVRGFKCFMAPSGVDEFEHVGEHDLREALPVLARLGLPLLVHAELPAMLRAPSGGDPRSHATWLQSRPPEAEVAAIDLLVRLARQYGAHVHVVHLAAAEAVPLLREARRGGVRLTVETCPHYLSFCAEEVPDGGTSFKCAPPIRERVHREALWRALLDGDIDLVATDHSPSPASLKCVETGDFERAWGGIASLQIGFAAVWTAAQPRGIPFEQVIGWMAAAPAALAGMTGRKGAIAVGADADLVVWDPDAESIVEARHLYHRHPSTPYAGMTLRGAARTTLLRGRIIARDGEVLPQPTGKMIGSAG